MNIFVLDKNPKLAAQYHCDKHVVKMILEYAQLLSTAHRVLDGEECIRISPAGRKLKDYRLEDSLLDHVLYKATHINHPCAIWARQTHSNYVWLYNLFIELCEEYTNRYSRVHLTEEKLSNILAAPPKKLSLITEARLTEFVQAMPEEFKIPGDAVTAYRNLYKTNKADIAVWKYSQIPFWFNENGKN